MLRSKLALLVALGTLILSGNIRADVALGIGTRSLGGAANSISDTILSFDTTSLVGPKIAGVGLFSSSAVTGSGRIFFEDLGSGTINTQRGTFNFTNRTLDGSNLTITWDEGYSGILATDRTYYVSIVGLNAADYLANNLGYITYPEVSNYWQNATEGYTGSAAIQIYYDTTSVPEPGTLILTGSALAAGAVGAYFKRRRKARTEAETVA